MQNSRLPHERRITPNPPSPSEAVSAAMLRDLADLLFASRDVARMQFTRVTYSGVSMAATVFVCVECRHEQYGPAECHAPSCRSGRLVHVLCKLLNLDFFEFLSQSSTEGLVSEERASSSPAANGAPLSARRSGSPDMSEITWPVVSTGGAR